MSLSLTGGIDILLRRKYHPVLVPFGEVKPVAGPSGKWEALREAPHFSLRGKMPSGWVKITIVASASIRTRIGICLDRGKGFNPANYYLVGLVGPEAAIYQIYLHLDASVMDIRLDAADEPCIVEIQDVIMTRVLHLEIMIRSTLSWLKRIGYRPREILYAFKRINAALLKGGLRGVWRMIADKFAPMPDSYEEWLQRHRLGEAERVRIGESFRALSQKRLFSILMPVYNTDERDLRAALDSVLAQLYPCWEACIVNDASRLPHIKQILDEYEVKDHRIQVVHRETNGGIVEASNDALKMASGEYVVMLDHDDLLAPDALYEAANLLNDHPDADMIYSDEDKITLDGIRYAPYFKPDWSPDLIFSHMYTAHLSIYRREAIRSIGGFRRGFEGAQDWDLVLRLTERTQAVYHIPKILYSWRSASGSTAQASTNKAYAYEAARRALQEALERRGRPARVEGVEGYPGFFRVRWGLTGEPKISILILTRDKPDYLQRCLSSIFDRSNYRNFEIILIDNQSQKSETSRLLRAWMEREPDRFRVERMDIPFNFPALNNRAAELASGDLLLLLNNDIEVISPDWLEEMAAQAQRPEIGAVGTALIYPNGTIQHAGIVLGINDWAGHVQRGFSAASPGYCGRLLGASNFSAVTGACMMVRRELFFQMGGLDPNIPVAGNDVEFCLRLIQAGYRNILLPYVRLIHYESISRGYEDSGKKRERFQREIDYVLQRWPEAFRQDPYYNPNLSRAKEDFSLSFD